MAEQTHAQMIVAAARAALGPLGVAQRGRSRTFVDDHGWWLINVEFQPSSWSQGTYINVGEQHLWVERHHIVFEDAERLTVDGSQFVAFDGNERDFAEGVRRFAAAAADAVVRLRARHGDGETALRRLASGADDLNAGIALAVVGDRNRAVERLRVNVHHAYTAQADEYLGSVSTNTVVDHVRAVIERTRDRLKLPFAEAPFRL